MSVRKITRVVAIAFIAIVAVLAGIGFVLPAGFEVERSVVIEAGPDAIHPYVNDLRKWEHWAGWDKQSDPTLEYSYPGETVGVGAEHEWNGKRTGSGKLRITESDPSSGIACELALNGDTYNATSAVRYSPASAGTRVTWTHEGSLPRPFGPYVVGVLEGALEKHFETGLERLKRIVENDA